MTDTASRSRFHDKLRQEQLMIMERGFKIEERKIIFVTALLGIAGVNLVIGPDAAARPVPANLPNLTYIWYLAPFIAVFFDALSLLQKYSVRRIGAFLRIHSPDDLEKEWEAFVKSHRDRFLRFEAAGFTALTFLSSCWMIYQYIHSGNIATIHLMEWVWLLLLLGIYFAILVHATRVCDSLDRLTGLSAAEEE